MALQVSVEASGTSSDGAQEFLKDVSQTRFYGRTGKSLLCVWSFSIEDGGTCASAGGRARSSDA